LPGWATAITGETGAAISAATKSPAIIDRRKIMSAV
jgi:hypothetical protein